MKTPENIVRHELIGLEVSVSESKDKTLFSLKGIVVDETRQTLIIRSAGKEKTVIKDQCIFVFCLPSKACVRIDGKILVSRPEDRIKKKFDKW